MKSNFKLHFSAKGLAETSVEDSHIVGDVEGSIEYTPQEFMEMITLYKPIIDTLLKSESVKDFTKAPLGLGK